MTWTCEACGDEFETLTRKRLHQKNDCPGKFDHIDADGKSKNDLVDETVGALLECQQCEHRHQGGVTREDDYTDAGYSIGVRFTCQECGFQNANTAILEGGEA